MNTNEILGAKKLMGVLRKAYKILDGKCER
jgi:hypothetical protein